jgi:hypothetical protein
MILALDICPFSVAIKIHETWYLQGKGLFSQQFWRMNVPDWIAPSAWLLVRWVHPLIGNNMREKHREGNKGRRSQAHGVASL